MLPLPLVIQGCVYRNYLEIHDKAGPGGGGIAIGNLCKECCVATRVILCLCQELVWVMTTKKRPRDNRDEEEKLKRDDAMLLSMEDLRKGVLPLHQHMEVLRLCSK